MGGLEAFPLLTMSTSEVLRDLYSLDTSSPDFSRKLYCLIQSDEEEQFLINIRGSELSRLVDFLDGVLDGVRALPLTSFQPTKFTLQVLGSPLLTDDIYRRCMHKLQAICGHHSVLPSSCTLLGDLARVGDEPVASGGCSDVWQGIHNGNNVCVKSLRCCTQNRRIIEKVCVRYGSTCSRA